MSKARLHVQSAWHRRKLSYFQCIIAIFPSPWVMFIHFYLMCDRFNLLPIREWQSVFRSCQRLIFQILPPAIWIYKKKKKKKKCGLLRWFAVARRNFGWFLYIFLTRGSKLSLTHHFVANEILKFPITLKKKF